MQIAPEKIAASVPRLKATAFHALFQDFHVQLIACDEEECPPDAARDRLTDWLVVRIEAAAREGNTVHAMAARAAFALAALADKHVPDRHSGATEGLESPIKERLFGGQATIQLLFTHIDELLRQGESADRQLAALYLGVLNLGFVGRRGTDAERAGAAPRQRQLHALVHDGRQPAEHVSPAALGKPAEPPALPPSVRLWHGLTVAGAVAFLLVTHIVWVTATGGVSQQVDAARAALEGRGIPWSE
ncbi:hypothetical protein N825_33855 [Skermanella stibiiresistens SB22]|uniref:Type IV / VI secretion system DotU domain-containing protein n=1 Tax=Skermanella stibiiresistens SB22 TaxID=1385369 RepID=W9H4D3_9PROT|nr:DotU family type IV/VI secretion system protein [Skermanella stibiiresistens]EWY40919.1 hypothetical protein N825_33855 [Skermanella stibiiresistens SB22]